MSHEYEKNRHRLLIAVGLVVAFIFGYIVVNAMTADASEPTTPACVPTPAIPAVPPTPEIPAVTEEVFDYWQRYSWTGGPHAADTAPAFPSPDWQPNVQGDPHGIGVEGAYFMSHGNSGNGDWFYLEAVEKTVVVTPAVPATPGSPEVPAVICPEPPTDVIVPEVPTEQPTTGVETPEPPVVVSEECPKPRDILFDINGNIVGEDADEVYEFSGSCENPQIKTPEPKSKPTKPTKTLACVDGAWVTKLGDKVVSKTGTCGEDTTPVAIDEIEEEGL
jgi:hypothetical protein